MTPAEMIASTDPKLRVKGKDVLRDRVGRLGWDHERAMSEPVGRHGGARPQSGTYRRETGALQAIADELGLSRERVRQIEQVALAKVRAALLEMWSGSLESLTPADILAMLDSRAGDPDHVCAVDSHRVDRLRPDQVRSAERIEEAYEPSEYVRRVDAAIGELERAAERVEVAEARAMVERVVMGMEGWQEAAE